MLRARVRNFLGVKHAELDLAGVVLIAGRNGSGKSSLLDALLCAALLTPAARGMNTRAKQALLLHQGADAGSASLDYGTGTTRITLPNGAVETTGAAMPGQSGSPLSLGAVPWSQIDPKRRAAEFSARAGAEATLEDLTAFLAQQDGGDPGQAAELMERIAVSGWDAVHRTATEAATKARGAWEHVTGDAFGPKKAATWRAPGLLPDEDYSLAQCQADLAAAQAELERLIAAGAVDQQRISALEARARLLEERQANEARIRTALTAARGASSRLNSERIAAISQVADLAHACPHCRKAVEVVSDPAVGVVGLSKSAKKAMTPEELEAHMRALRENTQALELARGKLDDLEAELQDAVAEVADATRAARELADLRASMVGAPTPEELARQRLLVASLQERHAGVAAMIEAREIYARWAAMQPLLAALAPTGARAAAAERARAAWNATLAELSDVAGFAAVALDADLGLTMGGRPFALLSESERWRCDALMTLALARAERPPFVVLDRLDVLTADTRGGVFRAALALNGIPVVIACSTKDNSRAALPGLRQAGVGAVWWMDAGTLTELPY
jgi:energy-coupling factor transporter ATP-binding protein EcfA2